MLNRIALIPSAAVLVFGSLIAFPAWLPMVIIVWVGLAIVFLICGKPAWPWLLGCGAILLIKRPGFTFEFFLLEAGLIVLAGLEFKHCRNGEPALSKKQQVAGIAVAVALVSIYGLARWVDVNTSLYHAIDQRPIACLGDSLTDYGYPQQLEKILAVPVADFGFDGITTDDGIELIPQILAADPQAVVIELGGHDYNGAKKSRAATRENLRTLITAFRDQGIVVVLVEIPRGFVCDPYDGLERELSGQYDLQLIDDSIIRSFIFYSPVMPPGMWLDASSHLSDDGLHPNELGNIRFAIVVGRSLQKIYGDSVLRRAE